MMNHYPSCSAALNHSPFHNLTPMKKVRFTLTFLLAVLLSCQFAFAQCTPEGNPADFGDHVWNVYAWDDGEAADTGSSWNTSYAGFYVDTNLQFNTQSRWDDEASPSDASGYLGCPVGIENHSYSAKRAGFACGYYYIDINSHDDEAELYVDGAQVWEHVECCDRHGSVWRGWLTETSTIEFRITEGGGASHGSMSILPVTILSASSFEFNCNTSSIILSANVPSPVWSTGETTPFITVTTPGNYSVFYDEGAGCPIISSVEITAAPALSPSLTGPLCHNSTSLLSGSVNGTVASIKWKRDGITVNTSIPTWGNKTIVAGNNGAGSALNQLNNPFAVAVDGGGNMYIADNTNGRVLRWSQGASTGMVYASGLTSPQRLFLDKYNNLYVSDNGTARVLKFAPGSSTGEVVAGGNGYGSAANQLMQGTGIFVDDAGNVYVTDGPNARIQKWAPGATSGVTVAGGNGQGSASNQFYSPAGLRIDAAGNMYVADQSNYRIQKWAPGATSATTVAGGNGYGNPSSGKLFNPIDLWVDGNGNLIILDGERLVYWQEGATTGSPFTATSFPDLYGVTGFGVSPTGSLYLTASGGHDVVKFDIVSPPFTNFSPSQGGTYDMVVTDFNGCSASASHALGVTPKVNDKLDALFCGGGAITLTATGAGDYTWNPGNLIGDVQTLSPATTTTYTLTSANGCSTTANIEVNNLTTGAACIGGNYLLGSEIQPSQLVWNINGAPVGISSAKWNQPGSYVVQNTDNPNVSSTQFLGLAADAAGNIYVCDQYNHRVMKWAPGATSGVVVAGGTNGSSATQLSYPNGIFIDKENNLYVCDGSNARVQKFANGNNTGITVAGGNFSGANLNQLGFPTAIYVDDNLNVYVTETNNYRVTKWAPGATSGELVAGGNGYGTGASQLTYPAGVAVDIAGNVYVLDASNRRVQKWAPGATSGVTVAGTGNYGSQLENFQNPSGLALDAAGNLYISDYQHKGIRVWTPGATQGKEPVQLPVPLVGSSNVIVDRNGNMYVAGYPGNYPFTNYYVLKYDVNGFESFAPTSSGDYSVTVTSFSGCSVTSASSPIHPSPYIVEGSAVNACTATGVTLTAAGTQNYVWTPGNLTGAVQTFMPAVNTVYTVTDDQNCSATVATLLYTSPDVSITGNACINSTLTAAINGDPAAIHWQLNGVTKKSDGPAWNITATTVAGGNGSGSAANQLSSLYLGIFKDGQGNLYIADGSNHRVQKWAPGATSGTTAAGGNSSGTASNQLNYPQGLFVDDAGNLYVADANNHRIQKFSAGSPYGVTVAGGNGSGGALNQLQNPAAVTVDGAGNIYVMDGWSNARVMKWAPGATEGVVVAGGNGQGTGNNQIHGPTGLLVDDDGNVYVNEWYTNRVQKWVPGATTGITVVSGLSSAEGLFKDAAGYFYVVNRPYVSSNYAYQIVRFREGDNFWTTIVPTTYGSGQDQLANATNLVIDANGDMYVLDGGNYRVQKFTHAAVTGSSFVPEEPGDVTAVAFSYAGCNITSNTISVGQTPVVASPTVNICEGGNATLSVNNSGNFTWNPGSMSGSSVNVSPAATTVYTITDDGNNCSNVATVKVNAPVTAALTGPNCIGSGNLTATLGTGNPFKMEWKRNGVPVSTNTATYNNNTAITAAGGNGSGSALNQLGNPTSAFIDNDGNMYIAELLNHRVTKWAPGATNGVIVAGGNGIGNAPNQVPYPYKVFLDNYSNLYVAESYNHRVLKFAPGSSFGVTVAGGNGSGSALNQLSLPNGLWVDDAGNVYVCEDGNSRITKWAPGATSGVIVAGGNGQGNAANQLYGPTDIKMDAAGNLYICEYSANRVTKWAPGATSGVTIAGDGTLGYGPVQLNNPRGIDFDAAGNLYIQNAYYNTIWRWAPGATQGVYMAGYCCSGQGSLKNVSGICVGKDGSIYSVDQTNYRIQQYPVNPPSTSYTPASSGDYTLEITTFANCTAVSNTVTVYDYPVVAFTGNQYFCTGSNTTLDAGTHQQYSWSTGGTAQTESFSTAGNYSVTVTDNTCATVKNFSIVAQTPVVSVTANPASICTGNSSQLNTSQSEGGAIDSYVWSPSANSVANPIVSPDNTTTYTLTATSLNCSTTATVTVNVAPAPGDTSVFGDHVWNVYAFNAGGATNTGHSWNDAYSGYYVDTNLNFNTESRWSPSSTPSAAAGYIGCPVNVENHSWSAKRKGFSCGNYQVDIAGHDDAGELYINGIKIWEDMGCCDAHPNVWTGFLDDNSTIEFRVTEGGGGSNGAINIIPKSVLTVAGPTMICPGFSVQLNAGLADSYLWNTGETTPFITVADSGNYSVTVSTNGCSSTMSQYIIVAPLDTPVIYSNSGLNYCPIGNLVDLNIDYDTRYNLIQWSTGNTGTSIYVQTAGNYSITVSDPLGCSATSVVTVVGPPGDPAEYGNGVWNVYGYLGGVYNYYGYYSYNYGWYPENYSGYYVDSTFDFNTENKWNLNANPSATAGYQGCSIYNDDHSWIAKRQGFPCGFYQIDVPDHDDDAQLYIDDVLVWEHIGCCDAHTNIWTGALNTSSRVEFRGADGSSESKGAITITPITGSTSFINVSGHPVVCTGQSYELSSALTGTSYLWSTGATTSSIEVSASGTFSVTVTDVAGCTITSDSVNVTILPDAAPVAHITASSMIVCDGNAVTLTSDSTSGNSWSTNEYTQSIAATKWTYSLIVSDSNGCYDEDTIRLTQGLIPVTPIAGNMGPACEGSGAVLTATGLAPGGQVASFNGTNQYITVTQNIPEFNYTVEMWVKTTAANTGIFSVVYGPIGVGFHDRDLYLQNGELWVYIYNGNPINTGVMINDGKWHHIALRQGTNFGLFGTRVFIDGVQTGLINSKSSSNFTWQNAFVIGYSNQAQQKYFDGEIDNVRIWNTAKSPTDIKNNMMLETPLSSSNLVYHSILNGAMNAVTGSNGISPNGISWAAPDFYTYTWTGDGAPAPSTSEMQTTSAITVGGNYSVTASADICGSSAPDTTAVTITPASVYYADNDLDGYGDISSIIMACAPGEGYIGDTTDCNDENGEVYPGASDICNNIDDDCNTVVDDHAITATIVSPTSNITDCKGTVVSFTANSGSGLTYQWMKNGVNINNATNATYNTKKAGSYQVTESNSYGCTATSPAVTFSTNPKPAANIASIGDPDLCLTGSVTLQANYGAHLNYVWMRGNDVVEGATTYTHTTTKRGTFTCIVSNNNGCSKSSNSIKVTKDCNARPSNDGSLAALFSLYPNPTTGRFVVEVKADASANADGQIVVMNMLGQVIFATDAVMTDGILSQEIALSKSTAAGVYFVKVMLNDEVYERKLVIQY